MGYKVHYKHKGDPVRTADFHYKSLASRFMDQKKAAGCDVYLEGDEPVQGVAGRTAPYLSDYEW
jgi:hypothetical protein